MPEYKHIKASCQLMADATNAMVHVEITHLGDSFGDIIRGDRVCAFIASNYYRLVSHPAGCGGMFKKHLPITRFKVDGILYVPTKTNQGNIVIPTNEWLPIKQAIVEYNAYYKGKGGG